MKRTIMEVDINKFNENIKRIKKYTNNKMIMPVIKANAYGTYINKHLDVINKFDIVAVATSEEGIELRSLGYQKDIFILNQPSYDEIEDIINNNLIIGLSSKEFLNKIANYEQCIRVHLEIETGMNRTGIFPDEIDEFINIIQKHQNIIVEGIYTHLSSADTDDEYTKRQLSIFSQSVNSIKKKFNTIKYIHSKASNGLLNYDDTVSNIVRPGIIMYGYPSSNNTYSKINVEPICKLKTQIVYLKTINPGDSVSYSRNFIAEKKMKVATIPIGYADGLPRELSNKGYVAVNNQKCRIIGNICMDSCMIDVTDIENVKVGDIAYIWDNSIIKLEDIAKLCNTINYEILCTISNRIPRVFK